MEPDEVSLETEPEETDQSAEEKDREAYGRPNIPVGMPIYGEI